MRKFAVFALLLCCLCLNAQQRSEKEAMQIAQNFFGKKGLSPKLSVVSHQKVVTQMRKRIAGVRRSQANSQAFYVINDNANNRFVIVSADDRLNTVLGYADKGLFDAENAPEAMLEILEGYNCQYDYLVENGYHYQTRSQEREAKEITPLIKSQWGQLSPFNDQCPEDIEHRDSLLCASGCVATAMAQIMYYYKYPSVANGSWEYYTASQNTYQKLEFDSISFDWNNMVDVYDNHSTAEQKAEVAKLIHACGVSVSMDYRSSSGAFTPNIPYALSHYFGYNPNILYKERRYYSDEEWLEMIMEELEAGRPILYCGEGTGGHQFIMDGCDSNGLFHFNFGWNGDFNGYFELEALKGFEWGSLAWDYSFNQTMVYNITPETVGKHEDVFYSDRAFNIVETSIPVGRSASFNLLASCYDSNSTYQENLVSTFNGEIGIGLFDDNYQFVRSLSKIEGTNLEAGKGKNWPGSIKFSSSLFTSGSKYNIIPYAKESTSSEPTILRVPYGMTAYYKAIVSNGKVELTPKSVFQEDIIPDSILLGNYQATAYDANYKRREWIVTLWQDPKENNKYWISNFDPEISNKGFTSETGWNKVYGYVNDAGTMINIPVTDQYLAEDIKLNNISGNTNISISLSHLYKTMTIHDVWGAIETKRDSLENITSTRLSKYSNTRYNFIKDELIEVVDAPIIDVTSDGILTFITNTSGAEVYYTTDGTTPSIYSNQYTDPIALSGNCTVKAIAFKNGKASEVTQYQVGVFVVSTPIISADGDTITISCATPDAAIYYTLDETTPSISAIKYNGPFECLKSAVINAIALKDNYKESQMTTYIHVPSTPPVISDSVITIDHADAGQLCNHISQERKLQISGLTVSSGELNGTDIKFIREMIIDGKLTYLDIANISIVSGGDPYYESYITTDDVISEYMFYNCNGLLSISLPTGTVKIENYAFNDCNNLKQIIIPDACTTIESNSILHCKNLESISLSSNVNYFDCTILQDCPNLNSIHVDEANPYFVSEDGILYSKDKKTIVGYPMGKGTSFEIPSVVTIIGHYAFRGSQLEDIVIPEGVTEIQSNAFLLCRNLTSIVIPNTVISIGSHAFDGCANLSSVALSSNLETIEAFAFGNCANLHSIDIPKSVKKINGSAFFSCTFLKELTVDEENVYFTTDNGVLYTKDMKKLIKCPAALYATSFQIPDGVEVLDEDAFDECKNIQQFYLPQSVKTIGNSTFKNCSMSSINLPQTTSSLGSYAFHGCDQLESFVIPDSIEKLPACLFLGCDSLSYVYIPANVKSFGSSVFFDCKALSVINCRISDIDAVEFKADQIDKKSTTLTNDSIRTEKWIEWRYEQFNGIPDTCMWRIPEGCKERYMAQPWWVPTWRIIEANDQNPNDPSVIDSISTETPDVIIISIKSLNTSLTDLSQNDKLTLEAIFNNIGSTTTIETRLRIWDQDMNPVAYSDSQSKEFKANSQTTVSFEYSLSDISPGNYIATIQYYDHWDKGRWIYDKEHIINFSVTEKMEDPDLEFVSVAAINTNLDQLAQNDTLKFTATFRNSGGPAIITTGLLLLDKDTMIVYDLDMIEKEFPQNEEVTIEYSGSLNDIIEGDYLASVFFYHHWGTEDDQGWWYQDDSLKEITVTNQTDIPQLVKEGYLDKHIYDINGRRLSALRKGINIIGGKKVLIK